ncbi:MAG: HpcH/HpaI aldolase/citrate lyase family protein [Oceanicaulis sp.]
MRSLLFVPGSRPDRIEKALGAGADAVCVDLEDAVGPDAKDEARRSVLAELNAPRRFAVRVNALETEWGRDDADALAAHAHAPAFVMLPKAENAGQIEILSAALDEAGAGGIVPIVESALGLKNAWEIAAADGVRAVLFGGGDMAADLGVAMDWEPLLFARSQVVAACAAANVPAIDVPFLDVTDEAGLAHEAERSKALGYAAKVCIHPAQIAGVHHVFTPSPEDVSHAERVIAALDAAGGGAALLDGKLIEAPIVRRARRVLERARAAKS